MVCARLVQGWHFCMGDLLAVPVHIYDGERPHMHMVPYAIRK